MIDPALLRSDPDRVRAAIRDKNTGDPALVDRLLALDEERRSALGEMQAAQAEAKEAARQIGALMKEGRKDEAQAQIAAQGALKERVRELEERGKTLDTEFAQAMLAVPGLPHPSVPVGQGDTANQVVHERGARLDFDFEPLPHWELTERHGLVDFERGVKVAGAGFPFYVGKGARLQRALVAFFLDRAAEAGFDELQAPLLVNADAARGTGNLPDKEAMMYEAERDGLFLIPTAEVPVTNFRADEILDALPVRYAAHTPCFRREAGSYGKDVRGLNRLHQFDKVELVWFSDPDASYDALETLTAHAESLLDALGLSYRRLLMGTGDLGFTQSKKYDLEVWSAGQQRWLEVSSVSNFETFQARRAAIRFRDADGKPAFVHTLNGSGLALPRVVAALLEAGQQADGSIRLPQALHSYTGFDRIG
jgi:seryl-tRNA synthetase